jgi:hypothetical protein
MRLVRWLLPVLLPAAAVAGESAAAPRPPYPDEPGYRQRIAGQLEAIAAQGFAQRVRAPSRCPDTGLPVFTLAVEGEEITSPYTGRRYRQGPTGYWGPKARGSDGQLTAFGGDPLKFDLPPATAALLLAREKPGDPARAEAAVRARAYLALPASLRQHYHFAAVNWARFLPLVGDQMPAAWHEAFRASVATYEENRRPSDGAIREYQPLPRTETLVGVAGEHLGGGGTENHKTMWRSAGLLYAQLLPGDTPISGFPRAEAIALTSKMLEDYVRQLFHTGSGEYDSTTYYPYSFRAFVNLADLSPDPRTRAWAQAALNYYVATSGLKFLNGFQSGAQRRGWSSGWGFTEWETHVYFWGAGTRTADGAPYTTLPITPAKLVTSIHQATSTWRPDGILTRLLAKDVSLPFDARIAHPDYAMTRLGQHPETLHVSRSFALGSVQPDVVNNSAQQTTWHLNVRGPAGSLVFGGGQPRWVHPEGHSPYDQWTQHGAALLLMTALTEPPAGTPAPERYALGKLEGPKGYTRLAAFSGPLDPAAPPVDYSPATLAAYWESARTTAAQWLWIPRAADGVQIHETPERVVLETAQTQVVVTTSGAPRFWLELPAGVTLPDKHPAALLNRYRVLVLPALPAVSAVEAIERTGPAAALPPTRVERTGAVARYTGLRGQTLELTYDPAGLRPRAVRVDGAAPAAWESGLVYASPYLRVGGGRLWVSDGRDAYTLDVRGDTPVWTKADPQQAGF